MKKNKLLITSFIVGLIIVVLTLIITLLTLNSKEEPIELYKITYIKDNKEQTTYNYYLHSDKTIKYEVINNCDEVSECNEEQTEIINLDFKKDNLKTTYNYFKEISNNQDITILEEYASEKMNSIFYAINYQEEDLIEYEISFDYKAELYKDDNYYSIYIDDNKITLAINYYKDFELIKTTTNEIKFNQKNKELIIDYIKNQLEENKIITNIYYGTLPYKDKLILDSIIKKDESILDEIDKVKNLEYNFAFYGLNCPTPTMRLYDDKSYEYYYTFTTNGKEPTPKTGYYNYDINILLSVAKVDIDPTAYAGFTLKNKNGETYYLYEYNQELHDFLNSMSMTTSNFACSLVEEE